MHFYADDTQLYIGIDPNQDLSSTLDVINSCLKDLKTWMSTNFLKLNIDKTNVFSLVNKIC